MIIGYVSVLMDIRKIHRVPVCQFLMYLTVGRIKCFKMELAVYVFRVSVKINKEYVSLTEINALELIKSG